MEVRRITADVLSRRNSADQLLAELEISDPMPDMAAYAQSFMHYNKQMKMNLIRQGMQDVSIYGVKNPWTILIYEYAKFSTELFTSLKPPGVNLNTVEDQVKFLTSFPPPKMFSRFYEKFFFSDPEYLAKKYVNLVKNEKPAFPWLIFMREYIAYLYLLGAKGEVKLHVKGEPFFIVPKPCGKADLVDVDVALPQQVLIVDQVKPVNIICKIPCKPKVIENGANSLSVVREIDGQLLKDTNEIDPKQNETVPGVSSDTRFLNRALVQYYMDVELTSKYDFDILFQHAHVLRIHPKHIFRMICYYKRKKARFRNKVFMMLNRGLLPNECHYACLQYVDIVIREARAIHKFRKRIDAGDVCLLSSHSMWRESTIGEPQKYVY